LYAGARQEFVGAQGREIEGAALVEYHQCVVAPTEGGETKGGIRR